MMKLDDTLIEKASKIRYFFTDVDGTLTDGTIQYTANGELSKNFSLRDGTGFFLLKKIHINAGIITGENSAIVSARANKLALKHCFLGVDDKIKKLQNFLDSEKMNMENLAYIGDDLNDFELLSNCGLSFCPSDAIIQIKEIVDVVCTSKGGFGAFRDAVDYLINLKGLDSFQVFIKN